jgi:hypothetical protein
LQEKIWVMALCRIQGYETPVWCRGNLCQSGEMKIFQKIWSLDTISQITWKEFFDEWTRLHAVGSITYRPGMANRHGHANICKKSFKDKNGYHKAVSHNRHNRNKPKSPEDF